jgi:hypothetical protein
MRYAAFTIVIALAATPAAAHGDKAHAPPPASSKAKPAEHGPGDHAHDSPHGGVVATIDKETHVEVRFADNTVAVWFYDADMKPIALPADAKATVVVGTDVKKLDLPVGKTADGKALDHLVGALGVPADQKVAVVIQATLLGKARSARVERKAASAGASAPVTPPASPLPAGQKGTP